MTYNSIEDSREDNRLSMREWVTKTFCRRECRQFVRSANTNKCGCGRTYEEHLATNLRLLQRGETAPNRPDASPSSSSTGQHETNWKIQQNTDLLPTNAFGTLEFQGADVHTTKAEYIRLSFDTKPQSIINLVKNYWQLEFPKLIISVHGGIANFGLQPKLKQALKQGLIKVVNTSHIWIITAGTDTGVVKHIGDILKEILPNSHINIVAIGIAPWGVVNERESLIGQGIEVPYFSNQRTINSGHSFNLNNCHSYFLLVDDGTVGKYGCEIGFRRRVERFLSRHKSEISVDFDLKAKVMDVTIEEKITLQNHHSIPLVCLIVEGGTNTIQTVLVNVHDKPPVPVVVCDGSGRAADLIAFTHRYACVDYETERASMEPDVQEQLISTIMKTFSYMRSQAEYLYIQLINCVKKKDLISIYRLGDDNDKQSQEIDLAILAASLKVIDLQLSKQLDIIMSWNRPDVAKKYILLHGSEAEKHVLQEKMFEALSQDKVEFVKLLLEYGVNLHKFLTFKRIQDLYNCKKGPTATLIYIVRDVVKKMDTNHKITLPNIGLVVEKLIGSGYVSEYSKKEFRQRYNRMSKEPKKSPSSTASHSPVFQVDPSLLNQFLFKNPYNELLVWAVLMKRHKMAMFVCQRGEETLAMALVAAKLNKSLAREAELDDLDSEISEEYKRYAEEFAALALGLLDKCYKEDDELTSQLLTYDLVNWSNWTCLSLAVCVNHKDFLSHAACQMLINDLWMGGMKIHKHVTYKIIAALLFPPALFAIQFKSAKELQYMPQTQEEHEQELENHNEDQPGYQKTPDMAADIGLTNVLNGLKARSDNDEGDETEGRVLEYDQSNAARSHSKMLSLDQIIEFYDEHNQGQSGKLVIDEAKLHDYKQRQLDNNRALQSARNNNNKLKFGKKIYEFYNAPVTKFWQNIFMYILFLVCFTYIVLVETPSKPSIWEIFFLVYIFSYGLDKIRELFQTDSPRFYSKIKIFFSNKINTLDIVFILSICVALAFRLASFTDHNKLARIIYCVNTIYWFTKLLEYLIINKYTGPLIIIASRMLVDLMNFIFILVVVLMSFGLSRQAIKFPNEEFRWALVKQIFLEPYFMLYGEVYAPDIDPACNMTADPTNPGCQYGHWITPLTMTAFMIVANLLFLSILIASFNNTYMRISRQSNTVWRCQRYHFVTSYESKPLLAPPFVVLSHIFLIIKYLIRLCQCKQIKFDRKLKAFLSDEMIQRLNDFEEDCFYKYSCDLERSKSDSQEQKITKTAIRVKNIGDRIDDIFFKENMTKSALYKVEMRMQKLEEITCESMLKLNNLSNLLRNKLVEDSRIQLAEHPVDLSQTRRAKLNQLRKLQRMRSFTVSYDTHTNSTAHSSESNSVVDQNRALQTQQQAQSTVVGSLLKPPDYSQVMDRSKSELRRRRNTTRSEERNREHKETSSERIFQVSSTESVDIPRDDTVQLKNNKYPVSGGSDSDTSDPASKNNNAKEIILDSLKQIDSIEQRMLQALENEENEDYTTEQILSDIYETSKQTLATGRPSGKHFNLQVSHGLDAHTLHPFVYLNSVFQKPPTTEYTSITDCIDTTNIDRPPSPQILLPSRPSVSPTSYSSTTAEAGKFISKKEMNSNLANLDDFTRGQSQRNRVARQESEMLRLAEESQHVIISQLANKIIRTSSAEESHIDDGLLIDAIGQDGTRKEQRAGEDNIFARAFNKEMPATINEEDETSAIPRSSGVTRSASKKRQSSKKHKASSATPGNGNSLIPLNPIDRKTSQIFYAQNQAKVFINVNEDDSNSQGSDVSPKKIDQV